MNRCHNLLVLVGVIPLFPNEYILYKRQSLHVEGNLLFSPEPKQRSMEYIGRSRGVLLVHAPPPQQDPILSFLHTFLPKSTHVGGWHPPKGSAPPNGKSWIRHWNSNV